VTASLEVLGRRLVGRWTGEATHPYLPGALIRGSMEVELLVGERFLVQRTTYDHPDVPDAVSVLGETEGLHMHYFDSRGVHRVYELGVTDDGWELAMDRDAPAGAFATAPFSQRMRFVFEGDDRIAGHGRLSEDGVTWEDDLQIAYRRA